MFDSLHSLLYSDTKLTNSKKKITTIRIWLVVYHSNQQLLTLAADISWAFPHWALFFKYWKVNLHKTNICDLLMHMWNEDSHPSHKTAVKES